MRAGRLRTRQPDEAPKPPPSLHHARWNLPGIPQPAAFTALFSHCWLIKPGSVETGPNQDTILAGGPATAASIRNFGAQANTRVSGCPLSAMVKGRLLGL